MDAKSTSLENDTGDSRRRSSARACSMDTVTVGSILRARSQVLAVLDPLFIHSPH